ncbi:alcohol dehydrogenase catalytic domain-containing protein [Novosphingobium resinovorum]
MTRTSSCEGDGAPSRGDDAGGRARARTGQGQVLVAPLACGVCGSDLHARDHADHLCALLHRAGFRGFMDPARPVVMGHEFCAELLESASGLPAGRG